MEKVKCQSCKQEIPLIEPYVEFKCPVCGKAIARCESCRTFGLGIGVAGSSADSYLGAGVAGDSADSNQSADLTSNSTAAVKKTPRVWINKMSIKSKKTVIKLKSDKKGIIYYTTDGSNHQKTRSFRTTQITF